MYGWMDVRMDGWMDGHHMEQRMDQPDLVANSLCGQLDRKTCFFSLSPFAP